MNASALPSAPSICRRPYNIRRRPGLGRRFFKEETMIFLETDRLILRNVQPRDGAVMYDYRNHEICARYQRG